MIRFYNGRVLSFQGGAHISSDEVWTDGGSIAYIGPAPEELPEFERQIDLRGDLLMPGFKNAHTHTAMTFLRSCADDMPLDRWLNEQVFPREARLTDEMVYVFSVLGIMEYLTSGVTSSFDMYFHNEAYVRANTDTGFRTVLCASMNDFDSDPTNVEREFLRYNAHNELVSYRLGIHAEYTTSVERIKYMVSLAEKYKAPCFTHLCETRRETEDCIRRTGKTPAKYLDELGFFNYGGGAFHCVYLSEDDVRLFREKGLWAVTCPASNLKLASGIAPIQRYIDAGLKLAIGTDGAASNNALDMFREMYLVTALQKYLLGDATACDAEKVLEMACVGGARAMGLDCCDDIAVGKKADLIVIDLSRPNMQPIHNIEKNLVYSGSKENVRLTMVNGRVLYENGSFFIGAEPERIYAKANEIMRNF
ncbi:MAG: amidohydrolase [Eubacteriales bacterium]|nr:amidohydrolase [Eubacteriales bacterium]